MWKAEYHIINQSGHKQYKIQEASAWNRMADSLVGEVPVIGFFTGYIFHPVYNVIDQSDNIVMKLKKKPSFFGKEFEIEKLSSIDEDDKERLMLGLMMMILLERKRS